MLIPIKDKDTPEFRCMSDLIYNANSKEYCNERGFKQKLIDSLYRLGYYENNESIFFNKGE